MFNLQRETPLYVAVFFRHTQLVELLMEKEADPNCREVPITSSRNIQ